MRLSSALDEDYGSGDSGLGRVGEYECQIITDFARLQELAPAWERLWRANPQAEIFQGFAWTQAWWQSFGQDCNLCTPVVFKRTEVVLILPLVQSRGKLRFLGWPQADYCDMVCSDPCPEQLFAIALHTLLESGLEWEECVFEGLRSDSKLLKVSYCLPREFKKVMQLEMTDRCPTIVLGESRNEVIDSRLTNKHVRRRLQKLRKEGVVIFRHLENRMEAQQQLAEFFQCHRRRCAVLAKASCFDEPEMRKMMRILVDQLDLSHELRFGVLELNGRPIAWSLGFQVNGKYAYYQQTFDLDAEAYAPGDMLLHYLLLYAKQSVEREFDFLRGDEFFKTRVATCVNRLRALYLQRPGIRGHLRSYQRFCEGQVAAVTKQLEAVVREHEAMFRISRSVRTWTSTALGRLRRARGTGQLTKYLLTSCSDLFRKVGWSKMQVTVFQKAVDVERAGRPTCHISDASINIVAGRFSDLADLALQHPDEFPGLGECRNRLKRGDQAYLVRQNGKLVLVAWTRRVMELPKERRVSQLSSAGAALEMYECCPIENVVPGCVELMALLSTQALRADADLHICCPDTPGTCEVELRCRGFVPKVRIISHRICHWIKYHGIVHLPTSFKQQGLNAASCPKLGKCSDV